MIDSMSTGNSSASTSRDTLKLNNKAAGLIDTRSIKQHWNQFSVLVLGVSIMLFLVMSWVLYRDFCAGDDTFIYLQYVKHLLNGDGLSFNVGERSYGFTSILWLAALSMSKVFVGDYVHASIIASLTVSALVILAGWFFAYRATGDRLFAGLVGICFVFDPNLLKHSYLGMETPLSGLLVFVAVFVYMEERRLKKTIPWSAFLCSASVLNRPESAIVVCLLLIDQAWGRKGIRYVLGWLVSFLFPIFLWSAFAYFYFGTPIPNTLLAKGGAYQPFGRFLINIKDSASILLSTYGVLMLVLGIELWHVRSLSTNERNTWMREYWLFYAIPFAFVIGYSILVSNELVYARYLFVFIPLVLYCGVLALYRSPIFSRHRLQTLMAAGIILQFLFVSIFMSYGIQKTFVPEKHSDGELCQWIDNNLPPDAVIASSMIGRIGFVTQRKVICTLGILNPEIIPYRKVGRGKEYFRQTRPGYFLLRESNPGDSDDQFTGGRGTVVHNVPVTNTYLLRQLWSPGASQQQMYLNLIEMRW